jgi:hypothetical protein
MNQEGKKLWELEAGALRIRKRFERIKTFQEG